MAKNVYPRKKLKVVVRPASMVLTVCVTLLVVFSAGALIALNWTHSAIQAETERLRQEAADIQYANVLLEEKTARLDSIQSIQEIAREELGLYDSRTVVIRPQS